MATVKLTAESKYGFSGQYIAHIIGRAAKFQFNREFVGNKYGKRDECSSYETDEIGLYEECDVKKNGKAKSYALVLPWKDDLRKLYSDTDDALAIAKRLDDGERLEDFVKCELGEAMTEHEYYVVCSVCKRELAQGETCQEHPGGFRSTECREVPKLNAEGKPVHKLVYRIHSKADTKKEIAAATLDTAVEAVVAALQALPDALQRKALNAAKQKLFPPEVKATIESQPQSQLE